MFKDLRNLFSKSHYSFEKRSTSIKNENEVFLWWVDKNSRIRRQGCSGRILKKGINQRKL